MVGTIQRVAVDFCGADALTSEGAIKECGELMRTKFGRISIGQIRDAFEMAACGQLGEVNIVAYKGVFTVAIFGEVMAKYARVWDVVVSELDKAQAKALDDEQEARKAAKQEQCRLDTIAEFEALKIENTRFDAAEKIPIQWAGILSDAGILPGDKSLWIKAKHDIADNFKKDCKDIRELRVLAPLQADKLESMAFTATDRERILKQLFEKPDELPADLYIPAMQLYGRLLIFNKIAPYATPQTQLFE